VAVEGGYYTEELLKTQFPGVNLLVVDSTLDALKAVVLARRTSISGARPWRPTCSTKIPWPIFGSRHTTTDIR